MTKTIDDYLKDPDIAHEPQALREIHAIRLKIRDERKEMTEAPECIREIHAIRLKLQDETAGMTVEEHIDHMNKKGKEILARWGLSHLYADYPKQTSEPLQESVSEPVQLTL